jgi:hypothetical protein
MIVAHRVQKRRAPAMPCDFAVQSAAKEKKDLAPPVGLRVDRQSLPLNDRLAWLVPRRKTRWGLIVFWRLIGGDGPGFAVTVVAKIMYNQLAPSTPRSNATGNRFWRPPSLKIPAPSLPLAHWRSLHHILE